MIVSDKGLLSIATARVQDRLPEIAVNLARIAVAASTGFAPTAAQAARDLNSELVLDPLSAAAGRSEVKVDGVQERAEVTVDKERERAEAKLTPDDGVNMMGVSVFDRAACEKLPAIERRLSELSSQPGARAVKDVDDDDHKELTTGVSVRELRKLRQYLRIACNCPSIVDVSKPAEATWIIDPARYASVLSVNCELQKLGSSLRVRVLRWPDARRSHETHQGRFAETRHSGIVYRAPTDYKVAIVELRAPITERGKRAAQMVATNLKTATRRPLMALIKEEHNFVLPNGGPFRTLPFRYSLCSVAGYQVQFVDGMPVRQQIDHRSELAACSVIPLQIIGDIIEAPIKMLDFQTRRTEKEKGLEDARRQLEESRRLPGPAKP